MKSKHILLILLCALFSLWAAKGQTMPTTSANGYTISFSQPYTYSGGNLLIGVYNDVVSGNWNDVTWYGKTGLASGVSAFGSDAFSLAAVGYTAQDFLPKITFHFTSAPSCLPPTGLTATEDQPYQSQLSWTANNGETSWNIYYKKASASSYTEIANVTDNPYTLSNLEPNTHYKYYVVANCTETSNPSIVYPFTTACGNVTTFPWDEDFSGFAANTVPTCWDNTASTTPTVSDPNYEYVWGVYAHYLHPNQKMLHMYNVLVQPGTAIINTMPIIIPATGEFELSFNYSHRADCGAFKVKVSTDNGTTFTEIGSCDQSNTFNNNEPGTFKEKIISLADYAGQTIILQFFATANYGQGAIFVDNVSIHEAPTCKKPSDLTADAITAHTATLYWTNGSSDQGAWQIAYSTTADFDPSSVTPVDVTTNPATLSGLDDNSTYYAYVRAYCGSTDYSAWCHDKVSFSTFPGEQQPTDLAVIDSTITPYQARIVWKGVATNDLHQNFEVYYSLSSTLPNTLNPENLIAVNDTTYLFTGLNPNKKYYVWVRDNCGTYGYSDWTSSVSFTTDRSEITVYGDETNPGINNAIPMYGLHFHKYTKSEFIIPATELSAMQWGQITAITFYAQDVNSWYNYDTWLGTNQKVFVKEVYSTTLGGSFSGMDDATVVFDGTLYMPTTSANGYTISFSQPFTYSGGNLLIGVYNDQIGEFNDVSWYGKTGLASGVSASGSDAFSLAGVGYTAQDFLPKTTFHFIPGSALSCLPPTGLAATEDQPYQSQLSWTANNGETSWNIYYKKVSASSYTEIANVTDNPYTLSNLEPNTHYKYYVVANCTETSNPSMVFPFTTACGNVTTFPWNEDFSGFAANTVPMCWDNTASTTPTVNSTDFYYYVWNVYSHYIYNDQKMLRMNNGLVEQGTALINTMPIHIPSTGEYELSFNYSHRADCGPLSVKVSTDHGTTFTEIGSCYQSDTYNNNEPGTFKEKIISLADYAGQSILLQFFATANYGHGAIFVDNLSIHEAPTCKKPSDLTKDATTAHSATLHWTKGSTDQNAWQIAYSTTADFDPNSVTPLDVTTNPVTLSGLDANTTYYAYVRANCGGSDYSAWCHDKVSFSTFPGEQQPTDLAVVNSTITTSQARVVWNGVATNDHENFEVYYSGLSTKPNPLAADSLFVVSDTTYLFTGLNPNKKYYVWVRDNCGTYGYSDWTSSVSFTTLTDCSPVSVATEAYTYDFENPTKWNCWRVLSGAASIYNYSYISHSATHCLRIGNPTSTVVVLPEFVEKTNTLQISFWHRPQNNIYSGKFAVGYLTDPTDASTFHAVETFVATDWPQYPTYRQVTCYFVSAPDGASIAFRQFDSNNSFWYVDDVEVSVAPLCLPVKNVAYSNITFHSATVTWTTWAEDQDTWEIKYNKETDFNPDEAGTSVGNLTETTYTFDGTLDANSVYYIYVRANCGGADGNSPWEKIVINTADAAPAPTTFDKTEVSPNWVDLYWNAPNSEHLVGYGIYYATTSTAPGPTTTATVTINDATAPTSEAPYRLTGLANETTYYVWIRANYDEANVYSAWKAIEGSSFTTLSACPKPTDLAADNITQNTAHLTWKGYSDNYRVEYRPSAEPFFDDFENGLGNWTFVTEGESPGWELSDYVYNSESHSMLAISCEIYSFDCYDADNWLISPKITMNKTLKFWVVSEYDDEYTVLFSTSNDISTFTTVLQEKGPAPKDWTEVTVDLSSIEYQDDDIEDYVENLTGYIAIHHEMRYGGYLAIDDFGIYGDVEPVDDWEVAAWNATNNAFTIENLEADTKYDVHVKGNCNGGEYSDVYSFTTKDDNTKIFMTAGDWNDDDNWYDNNIPENMTQNVIIRADATIPASCVAYAKNIVFEGSPKPTLTIADGGQLHSSSDFNATVQKNITGYGNDNSVKTGWYTIATPTYFTPAGEMLANTYDLYRYDEEYAQWRNYKKDGPYYHFDMFPYQGYLYANAENTTLSFAGSMTATNKPNVSVALRYTDAIGSQKGFNLVGNPFTRNLTGGDLKLAGSTLTTYYVVEGGGELVSRALSETPIKPGQGFLVQATAQNQQLVFNPSSRGEDVTKPAFIRIEAGNDDFMDRAYIQVGQGNTLRKMTINGNVPHVYVQHDNGAYAAATIEATEGEIPVGFKASSNGQYTLTVSTKGLDVDYLHLIDNITGADVDLLSTQNVIAGEDPQSPASSYTFTAKTTDYESRFKLVFVANNEGGASTGSANFAFVNNGEIIIVGDAGTASLQVIDMMGRVMFQGDAINRVSTGRFVPGMYVLRLINGNDVKTQKLIIK